MKLPGYYSSGEFARMAQVSLRTIRFYDKKNILKPSYVNENGARFYTDSDFAKLQQIMLLKYLGFSLNDIREIVIDEMNQHYLIHSLELQKKLIQDRIEQMQLVEQAIDNTIDTLHQGQHMDWSQMLNLVHLSNIEKTIKKQYQNASNISARILLHQHYSTNKLGWFNWIYNQCSITSGMCILEIGCGNGALWSEHNNSLPLNVEVILSDISEGMIRDARRNVGTEDTRFDFATFDCHNIPYDKERFDIVIANHVLFYCKDIPQVCQEIARVLKPGGTFICSTYGAKHMQEITELVQSFDSHIMLAAEQLYEQFGLENGHKILSPYFSTVDMKQYADSIEINQAEPLIEYILSCHGNQNHIILDQYSEFKTFVEQKVKHTFHITKDAGIFLCTK